MDNWKRFINDISYEILVPPLGLNFRSMNSKQAKENFDWFISKLPERTQYLGDRCIKDMKISSEKLDLVPNSLIILWKWFLETARIEKTPDDIVFQMKKNYGHLGESFINYNQFTVSTQFILRDIGMFLGEIFTHNFEVIHWDYYTKPKNDIFVNQPLLVGFVDCQYHPPFKLPFQPIHMAEVQASKIFDKTAKETDLYEIYYKWIKYIPSNI